MHESGRSTRRSQKITSYGALLTRSVYIIIFYVFAFIFCSLGLIQHKIMSLSSEYTITYELTDSDSICTTTTYNAGEICTITFNITSDFNGPVYVYYQLTNFFQNHLRYMKSKSDFQLMGNDLSFDEVYTDCFPLVGNDSLLLNPCGLMANSFFNDIISLNSSSLGAEVYLDTDGISWFYDDNNIKYSQVDGFVSAIVTNTSLNCSQVLGDEMYSDCGVYVDSVENITYYYWYPNDDTVQYLYESFPGIVNPIEGVTNQHFINWMHASTFSNFVKYYGKIDGDYKAGDFISFDIELNFETSSFAGTKAIVLTNMSIFGPQNRAVGRSYFIVAAFSFVIGVAFTLRRIFFPRLLGDIRALSNSFRHHQYSASI